MSHCVYLITSPNDPLQYVGCTKDANKRWKAHKGAASQRSTPLGCAMADNGRDSYVMEIVSSYKDPFDARSAEAALIQKLIDSGVRLHNVAKGSVTGWRDFATAEEQTKYDDWTRLEDEQLDKAKLCGTWIRRMADTARARMRKASRQ